MTDNHNREDPAAEGADIPKNVVTFEGKPLPTKSAEELERKRMITFRALELAAKQLEHDALEMEKAAIVGEHPIQRRHELMDQARALRMSQSWIVNGLLHPQVKENAG